MQFGALEPRPRPTDLLDPHSEKPQTGANGPPPRMNAEFVEGTGVVIAEFEDRAAGLSAMVPRDLFGRDGLVTGIPRRVDRYFCPREARECRQQLQPKLRSKSASRQQDIWPEDKMRVANREVVLVEERRPYWHTRVEAVGLDGDPSILALAPLELRRQRDVQKWVAGSRADPAPRRRLDVLQQKT